MIEKSSRLPGHYFYPPLYPVVFTFAAASAQKEIKKIRESERNGSEWGREKQSSHTRECCEGRSWDRWVWREQRRSWHGEWRECGEQVEWEWETSTSEAAAASASPATTPSTMISEATPETASLSPFVLVIVKQLCNARGREQCSTGETWNWIEWRKQKKRKTFFIGFCLASVLWALLPFACLVFLFLVGILLLIGRINISTLRMDLLYQDVRDPLCTHGSLRGYNYIYVVITLNNTMMYN